MSTTGQHVDRMRVRLQVAQVRDQIMELRSADFYTTEQMLDLYGQHERLVASLRSVIL